MITLLLGLTFLWLFVGCCKRNVKKVFKSHFITSLIVITYFFHPNYVGFFMNNLSCKEYDDVEYLSNNMSQVCWDWEHKLYSGVITIPMGILWMIILPYLVFRIIRRFHQKKSSSHPEVVTYFVIGFKPKYFFWEFVILIEKYTIMLTPLIFKGVVTLPSLLLNAGLILIFLVIQAELNPYSIPHLNKLQLLSLYSCFMSYLISISILVTNQPYVNYIISTIYFLSNGIFYVFWAFLYYKMVLKVELGKLKKKGAKQEDKKPSTNRERKIKLGYNEPRALAEKMD